MPSLFFMTATLRHENERTGTSRFPFFFSRASPPSIFAIAPNSGNFCPYTQPCRPKGVFTRMHAGHQPRIRRTFVRPV